MHEIKQIKLSDIDTGRLPKDYSPKVVEFVAAINIMGAVFPPVKLERSGNRYVLKGGRHRFKAHQVLGKTHISALVATRTTQP